VSAEPGRRSALTSNQPFLASRIGRSGAAAKRTVPTASAPAARFVWPFDDAQLRRESQLTDVLFPSLALSISSYTSSLAISQCIYEQVSEEQNRATKERKAALKNLKIQSLRAQGVDPSHVVGQQLSASPRARAHLRTTSMPYMPSRLAPAAPIQGWAPEIPQVRIKRLASSLPTTSSLTRSLPSPSRLSVGVFCPSSLVGRSLVAPVPFGPHRHAGTRGLHCQLWPGLTRRAADVLDRSRAVDDDRPGLDPAPEPVALAGQPL